MSIDDCIKNYKPITSLHETLINLVPGSKECILISNTTINLGFKLSQLTNIYKCKDKYLLQYEGDFTNTFYTKKFKETIDFFNTYDVERKRGTNESISIRDIDSQDINLYELTNLINYNMRKSLIFQMKSYLMYHLRFDESEVTNDVLDYFSNIYIHTLEKLYTVGYVYDYHSAYGIELCNLCIKLIKFDKYSLSKFDIWIQNENSDIHRLEYEVR